MDRDIDVLVHEVGPRDGLQATNLIMSTDGKVEWIAALKDAGLRKIQVGSFVPPKLLPQLADSDVVVRAAKGIGGFAVSALVPNLIGAQKALDAGVDQLNFVMSASEAHNMSNVRKTRQESLAEFTKIVDLRNSDPSYAHTTLSGGIATAFGCTISGVVHPTCVYSIMERYMEIGADSISISDTVGYANPKQVQAIYTDAKALAGPIPIGAHFHDTRGMGLANAFAALEAGVRYLDGCLGGLGGCPFAPGASGNVVTEDMVFMIEAIGLRTGIDLDKLLHAREVMKRLLLKEPTHGALAKAGVPKGFVPATRLQSATHPGKKT